MNNPIITNMPDGLEGFVFVFEGANTFLGKLQRDPMGPYLEPVYVYRVVEAARVNPITQAREVIGEQRELRPVLGYPEVRRLDLASGSGVSIDQLGPENRRQLAALVERYEEQWRAMQRVQLVAGG